MLVRVLVVARAAAAPAAALVETGHVCGCKATFSHTLCLLCLQGRQRSGVCFSNYTSAVTLSVDAVDQSVAIKVVDDGFEACTGA